MTRGGTFHRCEGLDTLWVVSSTVGVRVDPGVTSQFVRTAEALCTAGISAGMRLLSGVRPDVPGLVLETMECLVTQMALVGTGHFTLTLLLVGDVHTGDGLRQQRSCCHFGGCLQGRRRCPRGDRRRNGHKSGDKPEPSSSGLSPFRREDKWRAVGFIYFFFTAGPGNNEIWGRKRWRRDGGEESLNDEFCVKK